MKKENSTKFMSEIEVLDSDSKQLTQIESQYLKLSQEFDELKARFERLANSTFESIAIHDKGKILEVNQAFCRMFGYEMNEVIGKSALELAAPESRNLVMKNILSGYDKPYEAIGLKKDGTKFHGELIGKSVMYKQQPVRVTVIRDMTEKKKAENELRKWEFLFNKSQLGLAIGNMNNNIEAANHAFAEMHGYTQQELIGKPIIMLFPANLHTEVKNIINKVHKQGHIAFETIHVKKDGSLFPVFIDATAVKDENDNILSRVVYVRDISERKNAEKVIRESEEKFRRLFEQSYDLIQSISVEGEILFVNKAWLNTLGYTEKEVKNLNISDIIHPDSLDHCMKTFHKLIEGKAVKNIKATFITKDGKNIIVEGHSTPTVINGRVVSTEGFYRDVTKRNQIEQELIDEKNSRISDVLNAQDEERHRIAAELHDGLVQHLTGIFLQVENFKNKIPKIQDKLIFKEIHHIQKLINNVINETKNISYNLMPSIFHDFGLNSALKQLCKKIEKSSKIKINVNTLNFNVTTSKKLNLCFYRIVQEAMNNILKHAQATTVDIQIFNSKKSCFLILEDNGKGFDINKIYKRKNKKYSMGLTNMEDRIREFGGKIKINSSEISGTAIIIEVPLKKHLTTI